MNKNDYVLRFKLFIAFIPVQVAYGLFLEEMLEARPGVKITSFIDPIFFNSNHSIVYKQYLSIIGKINKLQIYNVIQGNSMVGGIYTIFDKIIQKDYWKPNLNDDGRPFYPPIVRP